MSRLRPILRCDGLYLRHRLHLHRCRVSSLLPENEKADNGRYGTAKSGVGISAMAVLRPDLMMKCVIPVVMAGIIAIVRYSGPGFHVKRADNVVRSRRFRPDLW